eukprot:CAMPEP_0196583312 /NCGR_PEP_ID=MMETSP1081-20130531/42957_1 /TAXON_ID=36882 /ORGANISM="Pyramimonas amylifera, Strain CCMP720" /LENGTH=244 /DNA_ID=CAMNT_0041904153 /DNA_START=188 /DNA_END=918 /DNA_ORIENTATION=+
MSMSRIQILLFGDSLTQRSFQIGGWGASLASQYERTGDVILRGYSGYNTRWALNLLPHVFPQEGLAPDLVTLCFGANDSVQPGFGAIESRQHVPLEEFESNLAAMLDHLKGLRTRSGGPPKVLLMTPPPVDSDTWHMFRLENFDPPPDEAAKMCRNDEFTKLYAVAVEELGKRTNTPTVNLYNMFKQQSDPQAMFCDGLHFTPEGNGVVFAAVESTIAQHLPAFMPSQVSWDFPDFKEIDVKNP